MSRNGRYANAGVYHPRTHCCIKRECRTERRASQQQVGLGLARVLCPKQRYFWARIAHQGARSTLNEFKATWVRCLAHHSGTPKILPSNLPPAAIADRGIGL
jgi:hypothetical protein